MFKIILPFYIICFGLYVLFTRQPDYIDGEFTSGVIHNITSSNQQLATVVFTVDKKIYHANASYPFRRLNENETVQVIYDTSNPSNASVYKWWGYWLQWDELLASIMLPVILLLGANAITRNPTPEGLINELEEAPHIKPRKYN